MGFWDETGDFFTGMIPGAPQAKAARDVVRTQAGAGQRAVDTYKDVNEQNKALLRPYLLGGLEDYNRLASGVRNGDFNSPDFNPTKYGDFSSSAIRPGAAPVESQGDPFSLSDLANDPGYQFRLNQGLSAAQGSAAARRGFHGGNALTAINNYAQGFASNEANAAYGRYTDQRNFNHEQYLNKLGQYNRSWDQYNTDQNRDLSQYNTNRNFDYGRQQDVYGSSVADKETRFKRLAEIAGYGQQSAQNLVNANSAYGNNVASAYEGMGNARAAGYAARGNAANDTQQNAVNLFSTWLGGAK